MGRPAVLLPLVVASSLALTGCGPHERASPGPGGVPEAASLQDRRPDVLLVTIEELPPEVLQAYLGATRNGSLRSFIDEAVVFPDAYTNVPLVAPAAATLMTGLLPEEHGLRGPEGTLAPEHRTLAERLGAKGWRTIAVSSSDVDLREKGLIRGFAATDLAGGRRSLGATAQAVVTEVERIPDVPLFVWLHLTLGSLAFEEGAPTLPAALQRLESALERVLGVLAFRGQRPKLIVLTALRGWESGEHGVTGAGLSLFEEAVRIPLALSFPDHAPLRPASVVSLLDLPATVLAASGEDGGALPGRDLASLSLLPAPDAAGVVLENRAPLLDGTGAALRGFRQGRWKAIEQGRNGWLFDLEADPRERRNLRSGDPVRWRELLAARDALRGRLVSGD